MPVYIVPVYVIEKSDAWIEASSPSDAAAKIRSGEGVELGTGFDYEIRVRRGPIKIETHDEKCAEEA